ANENRPASRQIVPVRQQPESRDDDRFRQPDERRHRLGRPESNGSDGVYGSDHGSAADADTVPVADPNSRTAHGGVAGCLPVLERSGRSGRSLTHPTLISPPPRTPAPR